MAAWNLGLRFILELAALAGIGAGTWALTTGWFRWVSVVLAPLVAAAAWGAFRVAGDTSSSGKAPVEVPGPVRLVLEFVVFVGGWWGAMKAGWTTFALVYAVALVVHHAAGLQRVRWLVSPANGGR